MQRYKKLDANKHREENFELKPYMTNLTMQGARLKFASRSKMMKTVKLNFKNDPRNKGSLLKCDECFNIDSQEHLLWCPGYKKFRENKDLDDDKDLVRGGFKKNKTVNLGLWPKLGGGVRTGSEGPIELFGDQKCQNNESFS